MPLLNKKPFRTDPPPSSLKEDEELFVCRQTNEAYRDYESFFKRTILCNSLVWSCEVTLKHGLTYEEATESEIEATKIVECVPEPIKRAVLTLVHYTRHSRLDNLCDEVFNYIRDRYQEGEEIDVKHKGEKLVGYIHNVIEPKALQNGFDSPKSKNKVTSPSGKSGKLAKSPTSKSQQDLIVLSDEETKSEQAKLKSPSLSKKSSMWPDAKSYQYIIKLKCTRNTPSKTVEYVTVKQSCISRKKGVFSREKLKLLLRMSCYRTTQGSEAGYWKVKDEYRKRFDLSPVDDGNDTLNVGKMSKKRKRENENNQENKVKKIKKKDEKNRKMVAAQAKKDKTVENSKIVKANLTEEEIERLKEELKLKREKEKELRKQEREKARQERSELLKEQKMFLLHWCVPQDDLDLDDQKELPKPVPVETKFPIDIFGDVIMVLEFLYIFGEFFDVKQDIPDAITLDVLEKALTEHDAEGSFYDIVRFLLSSILKTHAEEEEEEGLDDVDHVNSSKQQDKEHVNEARHDDQNGEDSDMTRVTKAVSASASMAAAWAQVHQGRNLHELALDPFTCSEILRLHFLSSGASLGVDNEPYRWQRRGGFTFSDDASVAFRHHEHNIMRALVTSNIYDLNAVEKLKILKTLCAQLLTYATTRDIIDDGFDRLRRAKRELQEEQWADQRKDKEEAAAKYRKRMEEKAKEREVKNKLTEDCKGDQAKNEGSGSEEVRPTSTENVTEEEKELKAFTRSQGPVIAEPTTEAQDSKEIDRQERKEMLKKKEKAYFKEIRKSQSMSGVQPIGTDRLFRRYWVFNSLNGLFIEDNDPYLPKLLQPEDTDMEVSDDDSNSDTTSVSTEEEQPDPSTSTAFPHHISSITSLSKQQIEREKDLCRILKLYNIPQESLPENCVLNKEQSSSKREHICAELNEREVVHWSYLDKKQDLDQLLNSLNPRGYREKYLRESLVESYDMIVKGLPDNPLKIENRIQRDEVKQNGVSQTVDKSLYKTMEDFIEASLRDQILDLEDRIWQAGLGNVKAHNITTWRKELENGIYDVFPDNKKIQLTVTDENDKQTNGVSVDLDERSPVENNVNKVTETMEVDEPPMEIKSSTTDSNLKLKWLSNIEDSRPGTPVEGSFISTPTSSRASQAINPCVQILAKALHEVEKGIERKYLIPPLGEDEETKKRRQQEAADAAKRELSEIMTAGRKKKEKDSKSETNEGDKPENGKTEVSEKSSKVKPQKTLLERWEESLMSCTNLAQVFIHLTNLDNCISWDKSVLNARCKICRRKGDAEHMLLCDGCDRGHHMYCLKPPIKQIPDGDWFCSQCRPVEPRRSIRRRKAAESDNEEEERQDIKLLEIDNDESEEESDDEDGDEEDDSGDDNDSQVDEEPESEKHSSDDNSSVHMESCACCDGGGELLCCETCPLVYHLECAYPSLRRIPRGSWACQVCRGDDQDLPTGRRVKKSVIKAAQKHVHSKRTSPRAAVKRAKIDVNRSRRTSKTRTDAKKSVSPKRQNTRSQLETKPSAVTRNTPAIRVSTRQKRTTTPKASVAPSVLSNSAPSKTVKWPAAETRKCEKLLKELMEHEDSWPFLAPVDNTEVPDYTTIIKTPMDLQTVKDKLLNRQYNSTDEFAANIRQIFFNCSEYNKPRTREARAGIRLSAYFETRYGELGLDTSDQRGPRTRRSR